MHLMLFSSAGDHVKFNLPMAFTVTSLAWGLLEFKDAYDDAGQLEYMYDCIRWPLEYLLKCHVSADEFYVQVSRDILIIRPINCVEKVSLSVSEKHSFRSPCTFSCHFIAFAVLYYPEIQLANSKNSNQTARMHSLIMTFVVRICLKTSFNWASSLCERT